MIKVKKHQIEDYISDATEIAKQNTLVSTVNIKSINGNSILGSGDLTISGGGGSGTNLTPTQTTTNFTINSDTGTDATIPLGNGSLAGATINDYTNAEKSKLAGITGTNTGDQNLQSVTNLGATTTNPITANSFVKSGGTSSQILAADGSVITAGTNITIIGGQISSVGGAGGGGSSVNYYLNGGTSQGAFGGTTYYEFSKTAVVGTGVDFNISSNGYIASFITDVADPSLLLIPGGNWNLEFFFSSSSAGGSPSFYVELYKYDGTTFTLITSNSATPEGITGGTSIDAYFTSLAVSETILTVNDRLAIRVFVNASSKTITLHTQDSHLCEVITTFTAGLTALNGLQAQVQNFATGTTGTDFDIVSSGSTHTFNLPSASATARGVVTTGSQTFAGVKTFSLNPKIPINGGNSGVGALVIDNGTGQIEIATNYLYPNLVEIQYVKGVTSSIQTQISGKQDKSLAAYSVIANNTNATANGTAQVFKSIAEQTFPSGNITWTGTTNPSGTTAHTYTWNQIGNLVTIRINLSYTVAGSALTSVACVLPSDLPTPALPSSVTTNLDTLNYGSGTLSTTKASLGTPIATYTSLRLKTLGTPNVFEIVIARASGAFQYGYSVIQYFV